MIKQGNDHFEVTHLEPKVDVCDGIMCSTPNPGNSAKPLAFNPTGRCPAFKVPAEIAGAALEKQRNDEAQIAQLVRSNSAVAPVSTGTDGGIEQRLPRAQTGPHSAGAGAAAGTDPARADTPPQPASRERLPRQPVRVEARRPERRASPRPRRHPQEQHIGGFFGRLFSSNSIRNAKPAAHGRLEAPTAHEARRRGPKGRSRRAKPRTIRAKRQAPSRRKPRRSRASPQQPSTQASRCRCASPGQERAVCCRARSPWCPPAIRRPLVGGLQ